MNSFKDIALQILSEAGKPLHSKEITRVAMKRGWLKTAGKTHEMTMNAQLITDINRRQAKSKFIKTGPSTFAVNPHVSLEIQSAMHTVTSDSLELQRKVALNASISSKQKGDIAEARVAELITIYGDKGLSCYKPISDDEGIDIIVKERGSLKTLYIQVKSRWQDTKGSMIIEVKKKTILDNYAMGLVVCLFDIEEGDLWDFVWYIPAPDFLKLGSERKEHGLIRFTAGKNTEREGRWDPYLIDKRDLANTLLEQMKRI